MPLVSIIVCVYNGEKYIKQCLKSIYEQTYPNIEIIVVDDGSTDSTKDLIQKHTKIKYIYQPNKGLAGARNTALRYVTGDYITMLDVDDLYTADKIEKQVNYLQANIDMDIVYNDAELIDESNQIIKILKCDYKDLSREDFLAQVLFRQIVHCTASMMFRKRCLDALKFPEDIKQSEDYYVTIQLAKKYRFGYLQEALYKYRRHTGNLTNDRARQQENEISIVAALGVDKIKDYVEQSNLKSIEKKILLAKIFFKIREYKLSIETLIDIPEQTTYLFEKWFYIGNAYYMLDAYSLAEDAYQNIIKVIDKAEVYNNLGVVEWYNNNPKKAQQNFNKAILLCEEYMDPKNNLEALSIGEKPSITYRELRQNLMRY